MKKLNLLKKLILLSLFLPIVIFVLPNYGYTAGTGDACSTDADCTSGDCDDTTDTVNPACVDSEAGGGGGGEGSTPNSETPVQDGLTEFLGVNPGIRTEGNLIGYVAQIIRWGLGLIGTVFFVLVLMSGFNYMTAGDDSNKAKQSLSSISNATIGLVLMIGAFLITNYIISAILAV